MSIDVTRVGFSRDSEEFRVNTSRLAQFAQALDDGNEAHRGGKVASPVFHHVPVMQSMVEVLRSVSPGFGMHGEHDFHFTQPIAPGMRLFNMSRLIGIGQTKVGASLIVRSDIKTHTGDAVSSQYSTILLPSEQVDSTAGEAAPVRPAKVEVGTALSVTHELSGDQTLRYADAARDYSPYTIEKEAAAKLGFAAPIVHGMCTLGFAARPVVDAVCGGETARLLRLGGRFSHPVLMAPNQALTTRLSMGKPAGGKMSVSFETVDREGHIVIKNGFAEVRS